MRRVLLLVGVLALMMLVMPTAMAKFQNQHSFLNGSSVDCTKCHSDVNTELQGSDVSVHKNLDCKDCHIALGPQAAGKGYHAAELVECLYCHDTNAGQNTTWTNRPIPSNNVTAEITQTTAAHKPFYEAMLTETTLQGANEACIGCHTNVQVDVAITEQTGYNISATYDGTGWTVSLTGTF
jgi:hypothetical protein